MPDVTITPSEDGPYIVSGSVTLVAPDGHVIAFNGKLAFEQFAQRKCKFGLQKELLYGARVYVLPETNLPDVRGNGERVRHFRKLAQLVSRTATDRDAKGN